jgi:hypothetical protein
MMPRQVNTIICIYYDVLPALVGGGIKTDVFVCSFVKVSIVVVGCCCDYKIS